MKQNDPIKLLGNRQPKNWRGNTGNMERKSNGSNQHKKISGDDSIRLPMRHKQQTTKGKRNMKHLFNVWLQGQHMVTTIMANSAQQAATIFISRNDLEIAENHPDLNIKQIY